MMVYVPLDDLAAQRSDLEHLHRQVRELQAAGSAHVLERRELKAENAALMVRLEEVLEALEELRGD